MQSKAQENIATELTKTNLNYEIVVDTLRPCVDKRAKESDQLVTTKARLGPGEVVAFTEGAFTILFLVIYTSVLP